MTLLPPVNELQDFTNKLLNNLIVTRDESQSLKKIAKKLKIFPKIITIPMEYM